MGEDVLDFFAVAAIAFFFLWEATKDLERAERPASFAGTRACPRCGASTPKGWNSDLNEYVTTRSLCYNCGASLR